MNAFIAVDVRPWFLASRELLPQRPICKTSNEMESAMNILGLKITVDPSPRARWTRRVAALGTAIGITAAGGMAYAFWTSTGTGSGSSQAGSMNGLVVSNGTPSAQLYPGITAADVVVTVSNTNPFPVKLTSLTMSATGIKAYSVNTFTPANEVTTCTASTGISWKYTSRTSGTTPAIGNFVIGAGSVGTPTVLTLTLSNAVTMDNTSDTTCQGAFFSMPITVAGQSAVGSSSTGATGTQS